MMMREATGDADEKKREESEVRRRADGHKCLIFSPGTVERPPTACVRSHCRAVEERERV